MLDDFDLLAIAAKNRSEAAEALLRRPFGLFHFDEDEEPADVVSPQASPRPAPDDGRDDAVAPNDGYEASDALIAAVNVALATGRPLLLTGEPGTGKTSAARWIARRFRLPFHQFQVRSDSRAGDLLYTFDTVDHFRLSQIAAMKQEEAPKPDLSLRKGPMWKALAHNGDAPHVLLIDEVDKAPRDFPNDLLFELDRLEFEIRETGERIRPTRPGLRPIVIITSNSERRLPEPFLRRCVYHHIEMGRELIDAIIDKRLARIKDALEIDDALRRDAATCYFALRDDYALQKRPSVDEFWQWLACLARAKPELGYPKAVAAIAHARIGYRDLPLLSALIKNEDDLNRL